MRFQQVIYQRGKDIYHKNGVHKFQIDHHTFKAKVGLGIPYDVTLEYKRGELSKGSCTCPHHQGGNNCKHMAALDYYIQQQINLSKPMCIKILDVLYSYAHYQYRQAVIVYHLHGYFQKNNPKLNELLKLFMDVLSFNCFEDEIESYLDTFAQQLSTICQSVKPIALVSEISKAMKQMPEKAIYYYHLYKQGYQYKRNYVDDTIYLLSQSLPKNIVAHILLDIYENVTSEQINKITKMYYYKTLKEFQLFAFKQACLNDINEADKIFNEYQLIDLVLIDPTLFFSFYILTRRYSNALHTLEYYDDVDEILKSLEELRKDVPLIYHQHKLPILQRIRQMMIHDEYIDLLVNLQEYECIASLLLSNKYNFYIDEGLNILKQHHQDLYLLTLLQLRLSRYYIDLHDIDQLLKEIDYHQMTNNQQIHILLLIEQYLENHNPEVFDYIEEMIKKGGFEDYVKEIDF